MNYYVSSPDGSVVRTSSSPLRMSREEASLGYTVGRSSEYVNLSFLINETPSETKLNRVAFISVGGLGDDLVKLNLLRQLRPILDSRLDKLEVTYFCRQRYGIFDRMDFVDIWEYVPRGTSQEQVSKACSLGAGRKFNLVFDARYTIQVLGLGEFWQGDTYKGMFDGVSCMDSLISGLGEFSFKHDNYILEQYLLPPIVSTAEMKMLEEVLPENFVVIANGTDPTIPQKQTKRIPDDVLLGIINGFEEKGIKTVQVGQGGVDSVGDGLSLIGETSLGGLMYLLERSTGAVCAEGGTAHLSTHVGNPTVVLFGPTDPVYWGYEQNLNIVSGKRCAYQPCSFRQQKWNIYCNEIQKAGDSLCMEFDPELVVKQSIDYFGKGEGGSSKSTSTNQTTIMCMTANIRGINDHDGKNAWSLRKDFCVDTIMSVNPDVVGLQEVSSTQLQDLISMMPEYGFTGGGLPIAYKKDRIKLIKNYQGCPFCTLFMVDSKITLAITNVHLDCNQNDTRVRQVRSLLNTLPNVYSQILMGDFNCDRRHYPINMTKESGYRDTYMEIHKNSIPSSTYHNFKGNSFKAAPKWFFEKIDFIFIKGTLKAVSAGIVRERSRQDEGVYPSDHDFVFSGVCVS